MRTTHALSTLTCLTALTLLGCGGFDPDNLELTKIPIHPYTTAPNSGYYVQFDNLLPFMIETPLKACIHREIGGSKFQYFPLLRFLKLSGISAIFDRCDNAVQEEVRANVSDQYDLRVENDCISNPPPQSENFQDVSCKQPGRGSVAFVGINALMDSLFAQRVIKLSDIQQPPLDPIEQSTPVPERAEDVAIGWEKSSNPFHNWDNRVYNGCYVSQRRVFVMGATNIASTNVFWRQPTDVFSSAEEVMKSSHARGRRRGVGLALLMNLQPADQTPMASAIVRTVKQCGDWPKRASDPVPPTPIPNFRPRGGFIETSTYSIHVHTNKTKLGVEWIPYLLPRAPGTPALDDDLMTVESYPLVDLGQVNMSAFVDHKNIAGGLLEIRGGHDLQVVDLLLNSFILPRLEARLRTSVLDAFTDTINNPNEESGFDLSSVPAFLKQVYESNIPDDHEFCGFGTSHGPGLILVHGELGPDANRFCAQTPNLQRPPRPTD